MKGSSLAGIAVAAAVFVFLLTLPFLLVVLVYTFMTIYAITKGTTFDSAHVNVGVLLAGIAVEVALLVCLLGGFVWFIDKAMGPARATDKLEP